LFLWMWCLKLLKLLKLWLGLGWGEGKTLLKHVKRRDQCYSIRIGRTWSKRPRKSGRYIGRGVEVGDILISWPLRRQGRRRPLLQFRWHEPSGCRRLCIDVVIPSRVFIRVGLPAVGHVCPVYLISSVDDKFAESMLMYSRAINRELKSCTHGPFIHL
jgi:hypothetical protein